MDESKLIGRFRMPPTSFFPCASPSWHFHLLWHYGIHTANLSEFLQSGVRSLQMATESFLKSLVPSLNRWVLIEFFQCYHAFALSISVSMLTEVGCFKMISSIQNWFSHRWYWTSQRYSEWSWVKCHAWYGLFRCFKSICAYDNAAGIFTALSSCKNIQFFISMAFDWLSFLVDVLVGPSGDIPGLPVRNVPFTRLCTILVYER